MATIKNARDVLLQAASPRVVPIPIPIDRVDGLPDYLDAIDQDIEGLGSEVSALMNNSGDLVIRASTLTVNASNSTTLEVVRKNGLTGAATWSVFAGTGTLTGTGDTRTLAGSSITGYSATIKAVVNGREAYATITKLGALSTQNTVTSGQVTGLGSLATQNQVNLAPQGTGQLAVSGITGLGALAVLNQVNLSTQTVGALNGVTQVTNLGTLAYANGIAANQIGAGTLAAGVIYAGNITASQITTGTLGAGVIYAGSINASQITAGEIVGRSIRTAASGARAELLAFGNAQHSLVIYSASGAVRVFLSHQGYGSFTVDPAAGVGQAAVTGTGTSGPGVRAASSSGAALLLVECTTKPPLLRGGIAFMNGNFIFCNGAGWYRHADTAWVEV